MGNSASYQAYEDVIKVMETAFETGRDITFDMPTPGMAVKFVSRSGTYRRLARQELGRCPWDVLRISRVGCTVTVKRWDRTIPQLRDANTGEPIALTTKPTPHEQNMAYEAEYGPPKRCDQPMNERERALWNEAQTFGLTRYDANKAGHHSLPDGWGSDEPYQKPVDNPKKP